jgi:hypothetical protein
MSYSRPICKTCEIITKTDRASGVVTHEEWRTNGKRDRADAPAYIERNATTGTVTCEAWYNDGELDRADSPAVIERDATTGAVTYEEWWKNGKRHHADGPRRTRPRRCNRRRHPRGVVEERQAAPRRWPRRHRARRCNRRDHPRGMVETRQADCTTVLRTAAPLSFLDLTCADAEPTNGMTIRARRLKTELR